MKRKIVICLLLTILLLTVSSAESQQAKKIPRIGVVARRVSPTPTNPDPNAESFRQALRDLGYTEGKNILVEYRYAEGSEDRISGLVAELVQLNVDVLVSPTLPGIRAAKQATKTIPIVMLSQGDPVANGLIDSLARPGGNITGIARLSRDLSGKRLELLKEAVPRTSRVGVIEEASATAKSTAFRDYEVAGRALKVATQSLMVRGPKPDFDGAFQAVVKERVDALITVSNALILSNTTRIAELAIKYRIPSMHEEIRYVQSGGLMSYSSSDIDSFKRAAVYVDKILKGAKPADLPVEQPMKFELVINLKTAKQIGLTIPPNVLARADKVLR